MVVAVLSVALVRHGICQGAEVCPCVVHARELSSAPIQFKLSGTAGSRNPVHEYPGSIEKNRGFAVLL